VNGLLAPAAVAEDGGELGVIFPTPGGKLKDLRVDFE
jgi:hypothetical protein